MSGNASVQVPLPLQGAEKYTRYILGAALAGVGMVAAYFSLPFIVIILKNAILATGYAITLGGMALGIAIVVPIVKNLWPYIKHQQKVIALAIAQSMIKKDPIRWIEIYLENHRGKLNIMEGALKQAIKALTLCKDRLETQVAERDENRSKAMLALKAGDRSTATRFNKMAERRDKSIKRLERRIQILEFIVRALGKMRIVMENQIADEEDQLKSYAEEYQTSQEVEKGIRAGMSAMAPEEDQRRIKEQALATMLDQIYKTHAELEVALDVFTPIIKMSDLEDDAALAQLEANFEKWGENEDSAILGTGGKQMLLAETLDPTNMLQLQSPKGETVSVRPIRSKTHFDDLIDGEK